MVAEVHPAELLSYIEPAITRGRQSRPNGHIHVTCDMCHVTCALGSGDSFAARRTTATESCRGNERLERKVLVTDFDGTMTDHDFYQLVLAELLPSDVPDHWSDYRAGRITHFEALSRYFAAISADEAAVLRLVDTMGLVPDLAVWIDRLDSSGWDVVVASAGCRWYIDRLLTGAGVKLETHTNDGDFVFGKGLVMRLPTQSPFFSRTHGIDKAAVVRHAILNHSRVAFAGDGFPDEEAARLVPAELRFARGDLARVLEKANLAFHRFDSWADVAQRLTTGDSAGGP